MTYEYNPYTLGMYSDHSSVIENTEDIDSKEEEVEDGTKYEYRAYSEQSKYS